MGAWSHTQAVWSFCRVPGTVMGSGDAEGNRIDIVLVTWEPWQWRQIANKACHRVVDGGSDCGVRGR